MKYAILKSITTECSDNQYGPGCNQTCGKCREDKQCHHINGSCNDGCKPGYLGTKCDEGNSNKCKCLTKILALISQSKVYVNSVCYSLQIRAFRC
jgi:hypothetical protein